MKKSFDLYFDKLNFFGKLPGTSGFTLPELLIVMTVIAALASIMLVGYPATQKRARDTRRKSDIKQYQTSMESYYNRSDRYPSMSGNLATGGNCTTLGLSGCPDDPKSSQHYGVSSNSSQYVIWARLEQPTVATVPYFVICSNGKSGENATASGPNCPLP